MLKRESEIKTAGKKKQDLVILLLGAAVCLFGLYNAAHYLYIATDQVKTTATITGVDLKKRHIPQARVRFHLEDGQVIETDIRLQALSFLFHNSREKKIDIIYSRKRPRWPRLASRFFNLLNTLLPMLMGSFIMALSRGTRPVKARNNILQK